MVEWSDNDAEDAKGIRAEFSAWLALVAAVLIGTFAELLF